MSAPTTSPIESRPVLPPLYFHEQEVNKKTDTQSVFQALPSELAMHCLVEFATWGELAKLATVQSSFKNLLRDAADHGGIEAKWELAQALLEGTHGLQRNPEQAVKYLLELALGKDEEGKEGDEEGGQKKELFSPAMCKLAMCYLLGDGVEKDLDKGLKWLEYAANEGQDIYAAHQIALIYEYSLYGIETDVVLAAEWFLKAAEKGHVEAMAEYAMCCELGCGREQSDEDALEWYTRAANMGHVESNYSVGEAFEEAKGVPQSDSEACLWYYKAAVMGDEDSKRALQRLQDIARIVLPGWRDVLRK